MSSYRFYDTSVARVTPISPALVTITFTGDDLAIFGDTCLDQRIKVIFPPHDNPAALKGFPIGDDWVARWRAQDDDVRLPLRSYTVRRVRHEQREVDVDFVNHGPHGPAGVWLAGARPGTRAGLLGPIQGEPVSGVEWHPGTAKNFLIVGDETALPAICNIVETLPGDAAGHVVVELPSADDAPKLSIPPGVTTVFAPRSAEQNYGDAMTAAVHDVIGRPVSAGAVTADPAIWDVPDDENRTRYAWLAGEAGAITTLRRYLVNDAGWRKNEVAFMGYWRNGQSQT